MKGDAASAEWSLSQAYGDNPAYKKRRRRISSRRRSVIVQPGASLLSKVGRESNKQPAVAGTRSLRASVIEFRVNGYKI